MTFSQNPQFNIKKLSWWQKFTAQVHQLFFTSTVFFAILLMTLSFGILENFINLDFSLIHGFGLNYAVFTNTFLGFLLTVIPKYNASVAIEKKKYLLPWIVYQVAIFITLFINIYLGKILLSLILFYFVKIFYDITKHSKIIKKDDSIFITAILSIGAILPLIELLSSQNLSVLIFFCFLVDMVFIVALRMIPTFYSAYIKELVWNTPRFMRCFAIALICLTGISMQFNLILLLQIISFISVIFFAFILFKLNLFKKTPSILSILVLGLIWFEIAYISLFLESLFLEPSNTLKLSFHIFALGFITNLLIGFGSRIIKAHAIPPQSINADKLTNFVFIFIQIVILSRIIASLTFDINILNLSSILWIVLFAIWSFKYAKILLSIK